jgi:hypothetical protein
MSEPGFHSYHCANLTYSPSATSLQDPLQTAWLAHEKSPDASDG